MDSTLVPKVQYSERDYRAHLYEIKAPPDFAKRIHQQAKAVACLFVDAFEEEGEHYYLRRG